MVMPRRAPRSGGKGDRLDPAPVRRRDGLRVVIALGIVSLLADMVYEGARSILGPFLVTLGASAATVGLISGIGE